MILRAIALCALWAVAGCAGAGFNGAAFQADVTSGNLDRAVASLKAFPDDDVSALLDRALLLQSGGDPAGSNAAFEEAERLIADLYTRSLSREALSLLTGDRALEYRAAVHEHAYIAYFRSWNYLESGDRTGVLVEARRISERLDYLASTCPGEDGACGHDAFLRYWSGLLFEWGGELNDAYVSYRQADLALETAGTRPRGETPPDLGRRLVACARQLGFPDDARRHAEAYGVDPDAAEPGDRGTLVFAWENGLVGRREEVNIVLPIFKGETSRMAGDKEEWSRRLAERRDVAYEKSKLEYLLRVALPVYVETPPRAAHGRFALEAMEIEPTPVAPLSAMSRDALERAMGGILVRATARALTKYLASRAADEELGEGAGLLVNLAGLALESAETRSWRSLPYEIRLVSVEARSGTHTGLLRTWDQAGKPGVEVQFEGIQVPRGSIVFARHRSLP